MDELNNSNEAPGPIRDLVNKDGPMSNKNKSVDFGNSKSMSPEKGKGKKEEEKVT